MKTKVIYKSADTGRIVSREEYEANPTTTYKTRVEVGEYAKANETVGTATPLEEGMNERMEYNKDLDSPFLIQGLKFGEALEALKMGERITCDAWWREGVFIFLQIPSEVHIDIVPKMTSLPPKVKQEFERRYEENKDDKGKPEVETGSIRYQNQIAVVYPDNNIFGWSPCVHDLLQNDWAILR